MPIDNDGIDDAVLALLHLTSFEYRGLVHTWKGHDWEAYNRLHTRGMISNPRSKAASVVLPDDGATRARELFAQLFERKH